MMSTNTGFFVDEASKKRILDKLDKLPDNLKRNALSSALNAGAKVIAQRAKGKAPACLVPTIKVKRRKQDKGGNVKVSVVAGRGNRGDDTTSILDRMYNNAGASKFLHDNGGGMKINSCPNAVWVEFGTYKRRDLIKHPYAPATLKRHPAYKTLGHTASKNWDNDWVHMTPRPFMRPAFLSAEADGSVRNAIIQKLDTYIDKKLGV